MNKIRLSSLEEWDKEAKYFLDNWIPNKIGNIDIHSRLVNNKEIKVDNYLDSISNAIKSALNLVCIHFFEINEKGLEMIVKTAFNTSRISIGHCQIHWSRTLDFIVNENIE